ncbi:LRR receptor-like serine/threonine-protein kinase GSO1 [Coffea eugenioides]|uniref:LRR receptor-like serine/threonine-protein kinase GSO1 n=1 Tax=Coffea eugenioides TaxID=49369 RepID=UPI000F60B14A|nr:LRR receptor-like serine/threonine-protein kinase GSO1 [Coffea eugenioides]
MFPTNITTDQSSLLALRSHISIDPLQILAKNWSVGSSVCDWIGVTCGFRHLRVTGLNISSMNLSGTLPPQLGNLSFLVSLDMRNNNFHGEMPHEIGRLRRLKVLILGINNLKGELPRWIGSFPQLRHLSFGNNSFTGLIPSSISNMSNLQFIGLYNNYLAGVIPTGIFNISSLQVIDLTNNGLSGVLPSDMCYHLPGLIRLSLSFNKLYGQLPSSNLAQCSELRVLSLSFNEFGGQIPKEIGIIPREIGNWRFLQQLDLRFNSLTGSIPIEIFNLSKLSVMSLLQNQLSSNLPSIFGYELPNLEYLFLGINHLSGALPSSISNSSNLRKVDIGGNKFTGPIPTSLGDLSHLVSLILYGNKLTGDSTSPELSFITSLTKCKDLDLDGNPLNAIIPESVSNLSTSLQQLSASNCKIKGSIPDGIGNLTSLILLDLSNNDLTGSLPVTMKDLQKLQYMDLSMTKLISRVPLHFLCALHNMDTMNLGQNQFMASIPKCFGNLTSLRHLNLSHNRLYSAPPEEIWNLKDLLMLDLSSNLLSGSLPYAIMNMKMANWVYLSTNQFSGGIPNSIGDMQNLQNLSLAHNRLQGSIPESIGKMLSLESLDLSHNLLSGSIPMSMENLRYLKYVNLSFNNLSGEIPSLNCCTAESFASNQALCGAQRFHVPPCPNNSAHKLRTKKLHRTIYNLLVVIIAAGVLSFGFVYLRYRKKDTLSSGANLSLVAMPERISYFELLQATNGYNESNLLGTGSFGSVYRGTLDDGRVVAVKVFNLQVDGAFNSFDVECEVLRNLRHRNLTKVISSCSTPEFKALVLEFMPNGSLEKWLYSHNYFPDLMQRLDILIDVACALQYLHCEYSTPVIHCDLKPSNVLLDQDMVAHLSDFGLTKLLGEENSITYTETLATLGYLAPEYGLEGLVSAKCDIYSFGIMIMEVFTRTNPHSEMFGEKLSLRSWVANSIPDGLAKVIDANLLKESDEYFVEKLSCIASIMKVALGCTMESPRERSSIQDVLVALKKIKVRCMHVPQARLQPSS